MVDRRMTRATSRGTMKLLSKLMDSQDDLLKKIQDLDQIVDQLERISISKSEVDEGSV
jgi:uncharacterized protein YoxC